MFNKALCVLLSLLFISLTVENVQADFMDKMKKKLSESVAKKRKETDKKKPSENKKTEIPNTKKGQYICDSSKKMGLCYIFQGKDHKKKKVKKGNEFACKMFGAKLTNDKKCSEDRALGHCNIKPKDKKKKSENYSIVYYAGKYKNKKGKVVFEWNAPKAKKDCKNPKSNLHIQGPGQWNGY